MHFRFFHSPLSIRIIEEFEHFVERLIRIVDHVGKCSALSIFQIDVAGHAYFCHSLLFARGAADRECISEDLLHVQLLYLQTLGDTMPT